MGFPSEMRDAWANRRKSILIASPEEERILNAKRCQEEGVRAGLKAASIACVVSAVPTLIGVRVIPWAKANLNYTAQALIISAADKTILESARKNSFENYKKEA
ncbi:early nodulin-93-like isoform X2 [Magnolia sinica]|uniref:early nodulin-93-like isoform X2 n=1 Tax=Magnolia sinica TaxID=86752 RepID=UPI00265B0EA1|nr:early nodulin-93-like isoform X2 [Magnolia sinica]